MTVDVGPGTRLLGELTGQPPERLATDPALALRSLARAARDLARLGADRASTDPVVRATAERRTAEIAALVERMRAEDAAPPPTAAARRFQQRLEKILRQVLHDLEHTPTA